MSLFEALAAGWDAATSSVSQGTLSFLTRVGVNGDYHEPGTSTNIYDPVSQASAAMNYIESRYGGQWEH